MRGISTVKYNATFSKKGDIVYISHLDLMSVFRRSLRRSGLPFVLTKGFTPRVKISIPMALKLGKESEAEEMSLWLTGAVDRTEVTEKLNRELPEGIRVEDLRSDSGR